MDLAVMLLFPLYRKINSFFEKNFKFVNNQLILVSYRYAF